MVRVKITSNYTSINQNENKKDVEAINGLTKIIIGYIEQLIKVFQAKGFLLDVSGQDYDFRKKLQNHFIISDWNKEMILKTIDLSRKYIENHLIQDNFPGFIQKDFIEESNEYVKCILELQNYLNKEPFNFNTPCNPKNKAGMIYSFMNAPSALNFMSLNLVLSVEFDYSKKQFVLGVDEGSEPFTISMDEFNLATIGNWVEEVKIENKLSTILNATELNEKLLNKFSTILRINPTVTPSEFINSFTDTGLTHI